MFLCRFVFGVFLCLDNPPYQLGDNQILAENLTKNRPFRINNFQMAVCSICKIFLPYFRINFSQLVWFAMC
jgi:hypothetical protein